ncbi:reverse transcriptase-like protein [Jatrophihabitans telluris]|uniref:Reverse transcriptase-like protein n=1 Tax=Jatrophihabitans telluris TaxID=2038343 RepID=A0ABY4R0T6_9ACTN|nr:reverse transcriptase-like protein [Jatrophihabitans telluris]UQX89203.1 reverse transcriptase-like protein [Jatrophihabitans telluris]
MTSLHISGHRTVHDQSAGYAYVLSDDGTVIGEHSRYHRGSSFPGLAEYRALEEGILSALAGGYYQLDVFSSSALLVDQMQGRRAVRGPSYQTAAGRIDFLSRQLGYIGYTLIPGNENLAAPAAKAAHLAGPGEPSGRSRLDGSNGRTGELHNDSSRVEKRFVDTETVIVRQQTPSVGPHSSKVERTGRLAARKGLARFAARHVVGQLILTSYTDLASIWDDGLSVDLLISAIDSHPTAWARGLGSSQAPGGASSAPADVAPTSPVRTAQ